jgi:putative transcriptional regulator
MNKNTGNHKDPLLELRALCARGKATPAPADVTEARKRAGLMQRECAELMTTSIRSWQQWESGDRVMKGRDFEFFCLLTHSHHARVALLKLKVKRMRARAA